MPRGRGPPLRVPDHTLLRIVGRGAYGEVWLARSSLGTLRAVKVIRLADFPDPGPFEREFRGIEKYEPESRGHDGLIDILQVGRNESEGYFYYVMELADPVPEGAGEPPAAHSPPDGPDAGEAARVRSAAGPSGSGRDPPVAWYAPRTLRHEIKTRGRLPVAECLQLGRAMAGALEHLHAAGLVHRDIKPSNIIFVGGAPKLADIGLVASVGDAHSIVGTEGYLPPEGAGTPEADVYGLGKVLYELSTGLDRREFPELPAEVADRAELAGLRELNEIVLRACARDPAGRYPTAVALRTDLERLQRGRSIHRRRQWEAVGRRVRRAAPAFALLALLALLALQTRQRRSPGQAGTVGERASVFVLPFRSMDPDASGLPEWLPGRMTDAFIDGLASVEGVRRSPRRSGWASRPEEELRQSLARTNDARHVLSGQVGLRDGDLRLRLRLHERAGDRVVWQETFVDRTNEVVALERRALAWLAGVLGIRPTEAEGRRIDDVLRDNAEAARLVADGWERFERGDDINAMYTRVISQAEEARRLDPLYLDARFQRVSMLRDLALFNRPPAEIWPDVLRELTGILHEDETHVAALSFMAGQVLLRDWDWRGGDVWALREQSWLSGASLHFIRAAWLRCHGEFALARAEQARLEQTEVRNMTMRFHATAARWVNRDYEDGIRFAQRTLEIDPGQLAPHGWLAHLHIDRGDFEEGLRAIERVEQVNTMQSLTALRGYAYARMGQVGKARDVLRELRDLPRQQQYLHHYYVARIHAGLGEKEDALDWLEKAEQDHSELLVFPDDPGGLRTDPAWDDLQDHPRFHALLKRVGLGVWPIPIPEPEP